MPKAAHSIRFHSHLSPIGGRARIKGEAKWDEDGERVEAFTLRERKRAEGKNILCIRQRSSRRMKIRSSVFSIKF